MVSTLVNYQLLTKDIDRSIKRVSEQPLVARETAYYLEKIETIKSVDDFLSDDRLYRYAMKAFGLEDMTYAKAFIGKALREGIDSTDAFANKLADKRYRELVDTFNFARFGEATTVFESTRQGVVDLYMRQTLEQDAGKENEGVRLALYFERKAEGLKSYMQVLADPALAKVMRTALGFPEALAQADLDKQMTMFQERFDIKNFEDPKEVDKFLKRFTTMWEMQNPSGARQAAISALISPPTEFGISTDVMMTLAKLR